MGIKAPIITISLSDQLESRRELLAHYSSDSQYHYFAPISPHRRRVRIKVTSGSIQSLVYCADQCASAANCVRSRWPSRCSFTHSMRAHDHKSRGCCGALLRGPFSTISITSKSHTRFAAHWFWQRARVLSIIEGKIQRLAMIVIFISQPLRLAEVGWAQPTSEALVCVCAGILFLNI